ncbi:possible Annexin [Prochlorococcus marinus str. MIT 9515]|uniref:Possible Annexin n=1 Tax=Prochlorococcus marinus (strain MIT 9515) TaxID=167542 RepID=A2BYP6_PROM5|nr:hypothetical protein [Prochlorococcus marinus]ABM72907.1 possible Annexin [Prochlorococcus marinus str. MIT 9515]
MLNYLTIVFIILIIFFLVIYKKKYIFKALDKKKSYPIKEIHNKNKRLSSLKKSKNIYYQHNFNNYSEFQKKNLRENMSRLFKGGTVDKLKALNIAEELADKSTLPILRKGLKDMNLQVVERSALLIRKFT